MSDKTVTIDGTEVRVTETDDGFEAEAVEQFEFDEMYVANGSSTYDVVEEYRLGDYDGREDTFVVVDDDGDVWLTQAGFENASGVCITSSRNCEGIDGLISALQDELGYRLNDESVATDDDDGDETPFEWFGEDIDDVRGTYIQARCNGFGFEMSHDGNFVIRGAVAFWDSDEDISDLKGNVSPPSHREEGRDLTAIVTDVKTHTYE